MLVETALAAHVLAAAASPLLGAVAPGNHAVAFRVLGRRDAARRDRPVQIALWLPAAEPGSKAPLAFRDYFALSLTEKELTPAADEARAKAEAGWKSFLAERGVPEETADRWLSAPMLARPDAVPARGRFPLVLVAQGNGQSAMDQAVLAEVLASHGYAVATCPSPMNVSGPMQDASEIAARAEEQAADLAFVLRQLQRDPHADAARIAVVGHSFGARGALLFAMQESAVRCLVSLDGGIGTALGRDSMEGSRLFKTSGLGVPLLHAYEELDDYMKPDFALLKKVAGDRLELLPTRGLHHVHFTTLGFAASAWPEVARATGAGPGAPESLSAVVERTLDVLGRALSSLGR
jgi:dienelactone hydrolase